MRGTRSGIVLRQHDQRDGRKTVLSVVGALRQELEQADGVPLSYPTRKVVLPSIAILAFPTNGSTIRTALSAYLLPSLDRRHE
jgi:hypothetical protein